MIKYSIDMSAARINVVDQCVVWSLPHHRIKVLRCQNVNYEEHKHSLIDWDLSHYVQTEATRAARSKAGLKLAQLATSRAAIY